MEPTVALKDYVDASDEAIESRLSAKLEKVSTKTTVWGAMATAVGILLAIATFGADRFDGGISASPLLERQRAAQAATDKSQDENLKVMNRKLDILVKQTATK